MPCPKCEYDYDCTKTCVDAWDLEKYYSCKESPNPVTDCESVQVGDQVEFNHGGERIWGYIVQLCSCPLCCDFLVEITSELSLPHPFETGDYILINIMNIYNHIIADENKPVIDNKCPSPYSIKYN